MSDLQTVTVEAAAVLAPVPPAPPFTAPWAKFPSPPLPPPAGFWTAIAHDPMVGGVVMQLGTKPHPNNAPPTSGTIYVGYQWQGWLPAGRHVFTLDFRVGPVSIRHNGGHVDALLLAQLFGPQGQLADVRFLTANRNDTYLTMQVAAPQVLRDGNYLFRFGGALVSQYQGAQTPYGEIIIKNSSVRYTSGLFGLESEGELPALFNERDGILAEQVSEEEAGRARLSLLMGA